MPIKRVLPGSPLDYPCLTNSSDVPRAIPSSSMTPCKALHAAAITDGNSLPLQDGADL